MSKLFSARGLAAAVAGAVLLSAGGAWAQADGGAGEDCYSYSSSIFMLGSDARRASEAAREAEYQAQKAQKGADRIRGMSPDSRTKTLAIVEAAIKHQEGRLANEGGSDQELEQKVRELKVLLNGLKDAELRANDLELTGGFVTSDRNAMDAYARELQGKVVAAKAEEQRASQSLKDAERATADCLARKARQKASLEREGELLASAAGGEDYDEGYDDSGYDRGYDDTIGSDAYPPRPSLRPPRVRPARPDRWAAPGGYAEPASRGGGRRARGGGGYAEPAWSGGGRRARADGRRDGNRAAGREGRDDRRAKGGGGKRGKGGKGGKGGGSSCHANPITGQQHCGDG